MQLELETVADAANELSRLGLLKESHPAMVRLNVALARLDMARRERDRESGRCITAEAIDEVADPIALRALGLAS